MLNLSRSEKKSSIDRHGHRSHSLQILTDGLKDVTFGQDLPWQSVYRTFGVLVPRCPFETQFAFKDTFPCSPLTEHFVHCSINPGGPGPRSLSSALFNMITHNAELRGQIGDLGARVLHKNQTKADVDALVLELHDLIDRAHEGYEDARSRALGSSSSEPPKLPPSSS